jgi:hypothetical protein
VGSTVQFQLAAKQTATAQLIIRRASTSIRCLHVEWRASAKQSARLLVASDACLAGSLTLSQMSDKPKRRGKAARYSCLLRFLVNKKHANLAFVPTVPPPSFCFAGSSLRAALPLLPSLPILLFYRRCRCSCDVEVCPPKSHVHTAASRPPRPSRCKCYCLSVATDFFAEIRPRFLPIV